MFPRVSTEHWPTTQWIVIVSIAWFLGLFLFGEMRV